MKYVAPIRKKLGFRTVFNILGPLTNPANASMQLMGVFSEKFVESLAHVLYNLGVKRAMVVYGEDGMDEISASAPTKVCEVMDGEFKVMKLRRNSFRLHVVPKKNLPEEQEKRMPK